MSKISRIRSTGSSIKGGGGRNAPNVNSSKPPHGWALLYFWKGVNIKSSFSGSQNCEAALVGKKRWLFKVPGKKMSKGTHLREPQQH